ncbi:MAG: tRNA pseudouridine(13) synthase TruD [Candidatus Calescibacterium sp.]|nr:tRNA pseudouridine(13) synthase TruD [Candidatus Calescibacterium sp.]MDW8133165.1 tRNA pseudouridine(13) synthase TruD [Candidatus Calescibacterium sp.]
MKIKYLPEDFIVEEILNYQDLISPNSNILLFKVKKKNITTLKTIEKIKHLTKCKVKFLGLKDKYSLSTQYITIKTNNPEKILKILDKYENKNLKTEFVCFLQNEPTLENLKYNKFSIILRDIDKKELNNYILNIEKINEIGYFLNYYDTQRINVRINISKETDRKNLKEEIKKVLNNTDFLENFLQIKKNIEEYTINFNFVKQRENLIKESLIFNLSLCQTIIEEIENQNLSIKLKLYLNNNIILIPSIDEIYQENLQKIILLFRKLPEISIYPARLKNRNPVSKIDEPIEYKVYDDEFHKERFKIKLEFQLKTGEYATTLIKHIIPLKHFSHLKYRPLII